MSSPTLVSPGTTVDRVWFTRCPVPTASGLAFRLGWLAEAFAADGIDVGVLQDAPPELIRFHLDHQLPGLLREGGNVPAFHARSGGTATRVVGLTWFDEWQTLVVRPDSGIADPDDLVGVRIALPAWSENRGASIARAMSLHGVKGALASVGRSIEEVRWVEVPASGATSVTDPWAGLAGFWAGLDALADDTVDVVYVKGASAVEAAARVGGVVGINLDALAERRFRVNNGTPRPITVHQQLLDERPELVVRFLVQSLRAASWAAEHGDEAAAILGLETYAGADGVATAYHDTLYEGLHPDLSDERVALLGQQKDALLLHGFLEHDVDVEAWVDREPLRLAREQLGG